MGHAQVSVYRTLADGSMDLLQSYVDENEDEKYYSCCWSESRAAGHANLAAAGPIYPVSWHLCGWIERIPGGTW